MSLIPAIGRSKGHYKVLLVLITTFLWIGVLLHLFPVYWGLKSSITPLNEIFIVPPQLFPFHPTFLPYKVLFSSLLWNSPLVWSTVRAGSFPSAIINTAVMVGGTMALQIPIAALAAYSLSKLEFSKWSKLIFFFFIGTMLVPGQISLIPKYLLLQSFPFVAKIAPNIPFTNISFPHINLLNTYWAVILPAMYSGFSFLLFKGHFDSIPNEIINAARIDGASELRILTRIVLPISKPIFAVVSYFTFAGAWNQFMWPLIVLKGWKLQPLSVFLYKMQLELTQIRQSGSTLRIEIEELTEAERVLKEPLGWNLLMAMSIIQTIPVFIMFIIFREQLMKGIKLRGLK